MYIRLSSTRGRGFEVPFQESRQMRSKRKCSCKPLDHSIILNLPMRTSNPPRTRIRENILEMREKGERKLRIQRHSRKSVQESRGLLNAQDLQYLLWQITRPFPSLRDLH